jgi:hypothetical protein
MSKEIDALVLVGYGHVVSQEPPEFVHEDIGQGLWVIRHGDTLWADNTPITEEDVANLLAGEIFLNLGKLVSERFLGSGPGTPQLNNPYRDRTLKVIDEISPFSESEVLSQLLEVTYPDLRLGEHELPEMFAGVLALQPSNADELKKKWEEAKAIHKKRGNVALMAYSSADLMKGLSDLDMDEIAPDTVEFDEEANVVAQSHNLSGLVDRTGIKTHLANFPYYETFRQKNAAEILASALVDLRLVSEAMKSL